MSDWDDYDEYSDDYEYDEYENERFEHVYRCYPVSFIEKSNLENGDKIIMPPSALDRLASLEIEYPMLFELRNPSADRITHCGVLEFTADEGCIYMPNWMMENLHLQEGGIAVLKNISLSKGTFVKLQPHTTDFLDISNTRAILETSLRSYSCLTTGDTIMIAYNNKKYYINVVETKPSPAISIIETDCEVDFVQPLDYKEPEKQLPSASSDRKKPPEVEEPAPKTPGFIPFTGSARRLDGKTSTQSAEQTPNPMLKQDNETKNSDSKPSNTTSRRTPGKLVFGSTANTPKTQAPPKASPKSTSQDSIQKAEEPKFQAFTGKKYSLKC
ncbi:hypothetical protein TanjilG_03314 [Lupinus angustifolius]|uniref:Ubiquitin fusion degradation protein n=1 Tax=Lupinus angustifolius TaxID=3871 RepID=A0A4P1RDC7_LUPAN|nr:PREDICTED: ubiquitin fusion degradation protein 1 homolog [Lupinus angustifolius]XP_019448623.1 PREDICTED: ubiquitin fusion degradation protein 1 homolog [Lupinus angustifolius]OIW08638.1 hypothetical protein TanjilG_03314 [Lupinus angustifolius]